MHVLAPSRASQCSRATRTRGERRVPPVPAVGVRREMRSLTFTRDSCDGADTKSALTRNKPSKLRRRWLCQLLSLCVCVMSGADNGGRTFVPLLMAVAFRAPLRPTLRARESAGIALSRSACIARTRRSRNASRMHARAVAWRSCQWQAIKARASRSLQW